VLGLAFFQLTQCQFSGLCLEYSEGYQQGLEHHRHRCLSVRYHQRLQQPFLFLSLTQPQEQ